MQRRSRCITTFPVLGTKILLEERHRFLDGGKDSNEADPWVQAAIQKSIVAESGSEGCETPLAVKLHGWWESLSNLSVGMKYGE